MLSTYPPLPQKSVCMSMTSKTVFCGRRSPFQGHGYGIGVDIALAVPASDRAAELQQRNRALGMTGR